MPQEQAGRDEELRHLVYAEVEERGGQIVSEHSVGEKLVKYYKLYMPEAYEAGLAFKQQVDPKNIMNPGAFFDPEDVQPA